jgi:hypothetical protein
MNRIWAISATVIICFCAVAQATIINVPADYSTIQQGINAGNDGDTVLVQPGTYVENINFNGHNIVLSSLFLTTGDPAYISSTIIDGDAAGPVILLVSGENENTVIAGFTIQNGFSGNAGGIKCSGSSPQIHDNYIMNNETYGFGGGAYADANSFPSFRRNVFSGNWADWGGGGLYIEQSQAFIMQCVISGNGSIAYGGGVCCNYYANIQIINSTLSANSAYYGGGLCYVEYSFPEITNSVFWGDTAFELGAEAFGDGTSYPTFTYSDIQNTLMPGAGNINTDPMYRDPAGGDYHLMSVACGDSADSPCIDAGDPDILDNLLDCLQGLGGTRSDMGAYGGENSVMVAIDDNYYYLPDQYFVMRNYPNPFNSGTTIEFTIVKSTEVKISIFDLLGREVRTLIDSYKQAGSYNVIFDADGLSSGVYFYRLRAGEFSDTRRMVLLK